MIEPKYDEEQITYGYLKKVLGSINKKDGPSPTIIRNYAITPSPPYNLGDTWTNGDKIYKCISSRSMGNFDISDWVIMYDTKKQQILENNLKYLSELEIIKTNDNKIETFYQKDNPDINWADENQRKTHIGDYYQNSITFKTYRYENINNLYLWKEIETINTIFDNITGHKNIFIKKPHSYNENDIWKLSKEDTSIFPNTIPGDFYKAVKSSEEFNINDWKKVNDELSMKANLYSNQGYCISNNNVFSNLQFSSFGKHNGYDILGFDKWFNYNGMQSGYSNVYVDVIIPKNFKILSAFLTLYHTPVYWSLFNDNGESKDIVGTSRNIKLYKVKREETPVLMYQNSSTYQYDPNAILELEEIYNAFGISSYTPTNNSLKSIENKSTINIKNYINKEGPTKLMLKTTESIPDSYDNRFACGLAKVVVDVFGYLEGGKDV